MRVGAIGVVGAVRALGVGLVQVDVLDLRGEADLDGAVTGGLHRAEDFRRNLQVPGVVGFAGFQHGAGRRSRIATTLEDHF